MSGALPELHGFSLNPRVMAARLALIEKGVAHRFHERKLGDLAQLRPDDLLAQISNAMPSLIHGDLGLYELESILRYIDEGFAGPSLQPATARGRAIMSQLMAILRDLLHPCAVEGILTPRIFAPLLGRPEEGAGIALAEERLEEILSLIVAISRSEVARPGRDWLLGETPSLADLQLAPILRLLQRTPEGRLALDRSAFLVSWLSKVRERAWLNAVLSENEMA